MLLELGDIIPRIFISFPSESHRFCFWTNLVDLEKYLFGQFLHLELVIHDRIVFEKYLDGE